MKNKVLVAGAAGSIGSNAVKRLLDLKIPVRTLVHNIDERSDALAAKGAEVVKGNLSDFMSVSAAMKDISKVLFVYPVTEGLLEATAYLVQAALEEKVDFIINISQRTSARNAPSHSAQSHWLAERMLDRCGVPVTHLQPTLFADWLAYFLPEIKLNNRYITPFGDARFGMINAEDIAAVAVAVFENADKYYGQTFQLYGPKEINGTEAAEILSDVLKRRITYARLTPEAFGEILKANDQPMYRIKHLTAVGHMFISGEFGGMNDNVEKISGHVPLSVKDFILKNITLFQ